MFNLLNDCHSYDFSLCKQQCLVEKQLVLNFIQYVSKNGTLIYRGDQNINELYGTGLNNIEELAHKIFLIGPKGEHFWGKQRSKFIKVKRDIRAYKVLFKSYQKLFDLNKIETIKSLDTKTRIKEFISKNRNTTSFFIEKNEYDFDRILKQCDNITKTKIFDYYISLLHTVGKYIMHGSYYVSTTENVIKAEVFQQGGIIYVAWLSCTIKDVFVKNSINPTILQTLGLPYCDRSFFPEQEEMCIKYGILPHYICGFIYNGKFYVNPRLVDCLSYMNFDEIAENGIYIDHQEFEKEIKFTKYKRIYNLDLETFCLSLEELD